MPDTTRYNKVIELLEHDEPVFSAGLVWNGNLDDLTFIADSDYDMLIIEMEHQGFSFKELRISLQFLLNRKRIAEQSNLQAHPVPMVRIPTNFRERNQWVIKQALDTGVYGIVLPHLNTVDDAHAAVISARYPQVPGVSDYNPPGERGWWFQIAPRYWGITREQYCDAADLWPLDPNGNMLLMGIIEEPTGVKNLRDILHHEKGIGAIWAGPGDLSVALGHRGDSTHPDVQESVMKILKESKNAGVPCAIISKSEDVEMRLEQGFSIIHISPEKTTYGLQKGRRFTNPSV